MGPLLKFCVSLTAGNARERAGALRSHLDTARKGLGASWARAARKTLAALSKAGHTPGTLLCLRGEEVEVDGDMIGFPFAPPGQSDGELPLSVPFLDNLRSAVFHDTSDMKFQTDELGVSKAFVRAPEDPAYSHSTIVQAVKEANLAVRSVSYFLCVVCVV
ncbi:unnamed protein product [Ectocarpus fasciculatus]